MSTTTHEILRHPVEQDGDRLAFINPNNSTETIHVASRTANVRPTHVTTFDHGEYVHVDVSWSVCGLGSANIDVSEPIYIDPDRDSQYVVEDGEMVGKLCTNCFNNIHV